ncbi:unnamed protein product [Allacma fusca]|uniref:Uncharacterized protein n=1 Tax=Allacma fusca TaxID=39272 RepID=A0A8J2KYF5_9HEXA|nr:unnamed protein product [Allacma fusca]
MHKKIKIDLIVWLVITRNLCDAEYILEDFKVQPFLPNSMALIFMAKVSNDGKPPTDSKILSLRMEMIKCCLSIFHHDPDCESMKLRSGLFHRIKPGETKSLLTFYPNKHIINRIGFCTFRIHGESSIKPFKIDFNTAEGYPHVPHGAFANSGPKPCEYIDEDPVKHCKPVNCIEKYTGYRSFYNETIKICEPTPFCLDTKKLTSDDSLLHKQEHQPRLMLNPDTNKCVNESIYKTLKTRAIVLLNDDESKMTTKTFAALYGITLAKLTVALILTLIFMIVICIVLKFCFCCLPCCAVFKDDQGKKYSSKGSTKYAPIVNEAEHAPDSATTIIKEVRDRREMTKAKDWTPDAKKDNSRHSNRSKDDSPEGSSPTLETTQDLESGSKSFSDKEPSTPKTSGSPSSKKDSTHAMHQPASSSSTASIITFRKQPNVTRLLHQVDSIGEKKSDNNSRLALSQDLERAFGRDMRFNHQKNNRLSYNDTVSMPQEIPDPSSQMLNLKDVPPLKSTIHQVQEPSGVSLYFPRHESSQNPEVRTGVSGFQRRHISQGNRQLEHANKIERDQLPADRFYKDEMAKAASFLRELEQRRSDTSPIYFEKRPLVPEQLSPLTKASEISQAGTIIENDTSKVAKKPEGPLPPRNSEKPIRRIKDEAPIPLSMICSEKTINRLRTPDVPDKIIVRDDASQVENNNSNKLSWEQQPDEIFATFHSPIYSSTPTEALPNSILPTESFNGNSSSTLNIPTNPFSNYDDTSYIKINSNESSQHLTPVQSFQSLTEIVRSPNQTEIPLQFQIPPGFKSKLAPFVDVTAFTVPIPVKTKEKPLSVKFQETPTSSKVQDSGCGPDSDFLRRLPCNQQKNENVWYCTGGSKASDGKFRNVKEINSQNLVHSPPQLSESETSLEGSECLESRNDPRSSCFFDDYLQPLRRPSVSDEILTQNRWIDNFRSE